ncbi:MAG: MFS transporter [Clostridium sp.]|nr:MFS transporter [Clostridium sp.]
MAGLKATMGKIGNGIKKAVGIEGSTWETLKPMIAYNSYNVGVAAGSQVISPYYHSYMTFTEKISAGQYGSIMFIKSIWDAVIDPFIGVSMDRTRSALGRHRSWLFASAIPYAITFFLLWTSFGISKSGNVTQLFAYHLIANLLYATTASVVGIAHGSMLPTLAKGYFERTQYISVGYIANSLGMVPAWFFSTTLFGLFSTMNFEGKHDTFARMGGIMAAVVVVPILVCAFTTKEPSSKDDVPPKLGVSYLLKEYVSVFHNRAFRQYFGMTFLYLFGSSFFGNSSSLYLRLVADQWSQRNLLYTISGAAEMLAFPLNYALTKKFGKQKCAWITMPLLLISLALGLIITKQDPEQGGIPIMVIFLFIREIFHVVGYSGIGFTVSNIYPDITDVDEMITGRRREGTITAASSFVKTMTSGFMSWVVNIILEWFGATDSTATQVMFKARSTDINPKMDTVFGLRFTNAVLPLFFIILSLVQLRKYKMTREDHVLIRRAIDEKRAGSEITLSAEEKARLEQVAGKRWAEMWIAEEPAVARA